MSLLQVIDYQILTRLLLVTLFLIIPGASFLFFLDCRWRAKIQDRIGCNRITYNKLKPCALPQVLSSAVKGISAEKNRPDGVSQLAFALGPLIAFSCSLMLFALVPVASGFKGSPIQLSDANTGILFLLTLPVLATFSNLIASYSSYDKFEVIGAFRSIVQYFSAQIFMGISLLGVFLLNGSLQISRIIEGQNIYWLNGTIPKWGIFTQPLAFIVFVTACLLQTQRSPFDGPRSLLELDGGYIHAYSGLKLRILKLADYINLLGWSALIVTLFLGGYHLPLLEADGFYLANIEILKLPEITVNLLEALTFLIKLFIVSVFLLFCEWSQPSIRFSQVTGLCWKYLFPLAIINLLITAAVNLSF